MGKASEIWKEIKPKIGEMLVAVNDIETQAEKAQEEAFKNGYDAACKDIDIKSKINAAYRKGLEDAWEAARKIYLPKDHDGLGYDMRMKIFNTDNMGWLFKNLSASEAIEKIRQYEQEKEEIKVGDEVEGDEDGQRGVVIDSRFENSQVAVLTGNSKVYSWWSKCAIHKTGRHFPELIEVMQKMRRGQDQ